MGLRGATDTLRGGNRIKVSRAGGAEPGGDFRRADDAPRAPRPYHQPGSPDRPLQRYEIGKLAVLDRTGVFDLVDRLSAATGAPKAYFNSALGVIEPGDGDLALDPRICDAKAAAAIASWLQTAN